MPAGKRGKARERAKGRPGGKGAPAHLTGPKKPVEADARQKKFIDEWLLCRNGTQAALRAGYSPRTAMQQASRLLSNVKVKAQIELRLRLAAQHADLTAQRTLEELRRLAFSDLRGVFSAEGELLNPSEWSDSTASAIAGCEVVKGNVVSGDGKSDYIHKVKLWDKTRALEMLAKHFKLLTDVIQIQSDDELINRLREGRKRAALARRDAEKKADAEYFRSGARYPGQ